MGLRNGGESEERFLRFGLALHEGDGALRDLGIDQPALLEVIHLQRSALLSLASFHQLLRRHDLVGVSWRAGPKRLVGRAWNSIPFVESLVVRQPPVLAAKVPLAVQRRRIPGR